MTRRLYASMLLAFAASLAACKTPSGASPGSSLRDAAPSDDAGTDPALAAELSRLGIAFHPVDKVSVDVENTTAFWAKVDAVQRATRSVDVAYFLLGDDYAGSHIAKLLVEKARQGVKVRIMVDAKTTMSHRAFFRTLVAKGEGKLQVAYFRPIPKVIYDDFNRLGIDPEAFINALVMMDTAAVQKQLAQSNVLKSNAALARAVSELIRAISQPNRDDVPDATEIEEKRGLMDDALAVARVVKLLRAVKDSYQPLGLKASGRDWFDLTKWTHHKLLLVDGSYLVGGGRNLEDAYHWEKDHKIRVEENIKKYVFMDVDFYLDNAQIAREALATYDKYWGAACFAEPPVPAACQSGIPMGLEKAADAAEAETGWAEIERKSAALVAAKDYDRTYTPVHQGVFTQSDVKVAYAENRMFPGNDPSRTLLYEEASQHNAALVAMIDSLKPGQDVVFQNAYLYFPANMQLSLMRAMKRGVNIVILSNSPESSDLGYVAQAARLQYKGFLKMMKDPSVKGRIEIYEYLTQESLHSKVEIIGDRWLVVGSINADPRCEFLDTNNGVIIDSAALAKKYKSWLEELRGGLLSRSTPMLRKVDEARIAQEEATPPTDPIAKLTAAFAPLAAQTFEDSVKGAAARKLLQSVFLQY